MNLTFYYSPMSTAAIIELVLAELEVPYEKVEIDLKKGETRKPEFLRLNPNGKVPLVVHDGTPVWESAAITLYLGEAFGVDRGLYPEAGPRRGEAMKWIVWTEVTLREAVTRWLRNSTEWTPGQHNAKAAEAAQADIRNCLRILNEVLVDKSFLLGGYTLADTHLNSIIDWLRFMKTDLSDYANLNAWSERCAARPAYSRVMGMGSRQMAVPPPTV